jgi:nitrogen regulatory protein P-II 1
MIAAEDDLCAMRKVQAIIREERLEAVVERLLLIGISGLTVSPAKGSGAGERVAFFRGGSYPVPFVSKVLVEWYGPDDEVDGVVRAIARAASTGAAGDGRIFVGDVEVAFGIRTGEPTSDL